MRVLVGLIAAWSLNAGVSLAQAPVVATMPVEILRDEGGPPRMGEVSLRAGSGEDDEPFWFGAQFDHDDDRLGPVTFVGWSVRFGSYCRDEPTWLQSIVVGPQGEVWRGFRVRVPAGPDRLQDWSSGATGAEAHGGEPTPGLLEAMTSGGVFILALEDEAGRRFNEVLIDTLTPSERQELFSANIDLVRQAPAEMPPRGERRYVMGPQAASVLPDPPRRCP